ncbi:MAG: hypothetical protein E7107_11320 [Prevotella sp.]|nr:hypothetical protein [Prevotella sp.]
MKYYKTLAWTVAIAIAGTMMTACSSDSSESEKPFTTCPVSESTLYACGIGQPGTRSDAGILFTEDDILWFDANTREIRFRDTMEPLREKIPLLASVDFYIGGEYLFSGGATFVGLICSQMFDDLVLCCGKIDGEVIDDGHYYLYDCYPTQFINDERVQANIQKRAPQWETFTKYLDSKGKLK